jgi:hypothetical protein
MKKQIPYGPDDEMCHRFGKPCSKVCFNGKLKCKLWKEFRGLDATGQECNGWFCVDEMAANMIMEVAKETRQAGAATESFRNEMVQIGVAQLSMRERPQVAGNSAALVPINLISN